MAKYTLLLCLLCVTAQAAVFPVPVSYDGAEIGMVSIDYQQGRVSAVLASELVDILGQRIHADAKQELARHSFVSLGDLEEMGYRLEFRAHYMDLELELASQVLGRSELNLMPGGSSLNPHTLPVARWANINNLTLSATYDDLSEITRASADWSGAFNVGGVRGVNLVWSGFADWDDERQELIRNRGPITLFHDQPATPVRLAAGDLATTATGHLGSATVGGASIASAYYDLQPYRRISPSSRQQIILPERADVEIYVNRRFVDVLRLPPGRYDLQDLPLDEGANEIEVQVYYASGETEVLNFSQFYNAQLLRPGLSNYQVTIGERSDYQGLGGIYYTDELLASGFYEYGLTSWLTLGLYGQYHDEGHLYGAQSGIATPFGNWSFRYSQTQAFDIDGEALSVEWQSRVPGARGGVANLRVAYEQYENFINQPWLDEFYLDGTRWVASYAMYLGDRFELRFNYQENKTIPGRERRTREVRAFYRIPRFRFSIGARQGNSGLNDSEDYEIFATVDFNLFNSRTGHRYSARYDSWYEELSLGLSRPARQAVGDFSYDINHLEGDQRRTTNTRAGYLANRFRTSGFANYNDIRGRGHYNLGAQVNTAVGWADGNFGWGRAGSGPFTVVKAHPSLGNAKVEINRGQHGVEAYATPRAGALLVTRPRFRQGQVMVDVPDAPIGYDWGGGHYFTYAGAHTGSVVDIGSDAFYSVLGTLVDSNGTPLELQVARLVGPEIEEVVFTNRAGRFIAEGLRPGEYILTTTQPPLKRYRFEVLEQDDMFQRVGTLEPIESQ